MDELTRDAKKYIESVGVELEAGYKVNDEDFVSIVSDRTSYDDEDSVGGNNINSGRIATRTDASISCNGRCYETHYHDFLDDKNLIGMREYLKESYKLIKDINSSCGFHIHVKFRDGADKVVTFPGFYKKFIAEYKSKFGGDKKYMDRLTARYCALPYTRKSNDEHMSGTSRSHEDKFTAINFQHLRSDGELNTVEFRIFPFQKNSQEAFGTIMWLCNSASGIIDEMYRTGVID